MITLKQYLTSSGKYPDRAKHKELTPDIIKNAEGLLKDVNAFLAELGITSATVSSGFRPSDVNNATPNAAKRSLHMQGLAIDLADTSGKLDEQVAARDDLKKKYGLWQEAGGQDGFPNKTPSWCHLDKKDRGVRPKNTFNP